MDIDIKKNGKVTLKDTPYFEPIDNTSISFSNMDRGTALITFTIKKNGKPLQVSDKNVYVYAYLESKNGTRSEVTELKIEDSLKGKVSLLIDDDFLTGATNSTVEGQLYITLHKWNRTGNDFSDTVALQRFSFKVKDALINKISGVTKTEYIRTFNQLRDEVRKRIEDMEENVTDIENLVEKVETTADKAIRKVEYEKDEMLKEMQDKFDITESDIEEIKEQTISELKTKAENYTDQIKNAKEDVLKLIDDENLITTHKFQEYKNDFEEEINEKLENYENEVKNSNARIDEKLEDLDWQKHKLTEDDGQRIRISDTDPVELNSGFYQMWRMKNAPEGSDDNTQYWNVDVTTGFHKTKQIIATISASGKTYKKNIHKNEDKGWKEISFEVESTPWIEIPLKNGVKARSDKPRYKIVETPHFTSVTLVGAVSLDSSEIDVVIGQVPVEDVLNQTYHYVQNMSVKNGKAQFARLALRNDNDLVFERGTIDKEDATDSDWCPIHVTFVV